jgi:hypothetical protein
VSSTVTLTHAPAQVTLTRSPAIVTLEKSDNKIALSGGNNVALTRPAAKVSVSQSAITAALSTTPNQVIVGPRRPTNVPREIALQIDQFRKGATAPTDVTIGTTPTIPAFRLSRTTELISIYQIMPLNWDTTRDVSFLPIWSLVNPQVAGDQISVTMDYVATQVENPGSGIAKTSTQVTQNITLSDAQGVGVGDLYNGSIPILAADPTNPLANATHIGLEFHLTNLIGVAEIDFVGACITYTAGF